jgi:hypothetical protein
MLNWVSFNESKNYGDLYHSIWRIESSKELIKMIKSILEKGIRFSTNEKTEQQREEGFFKFLKNKYFISTTRDKNTIKKYPVTFVIDGNSVSDRYKIEPFNLSGKVNISYTNYMKKTYGDYKNWPTKTKDSMYLKLMNSRYSSEEKILTNKEGFLSTKYIKEIIINKPDKELFEFINNLDINIKVTIIN